MSHFVSKVMSGIKAEINPVEPHYFFTVWIFNIVRRLPCLTNVSRYLVKISLFIFFFCPKYTFSYIYIYTTKHVYVKFSCTTFGFLSVEHSIPLKSMKYLWIRDIFAKWLTSSSQLILKLRSMCVCMLKYSRKDLLQSEHKNSSEEKKTYWY